MAFIKPSELPSRAVVIVVEFDRILTESELEKVVPTMVGRVRAQGIPENLDITARPVRLYGGSVEMEADEGPPEPPPLRPV